MLTYSVNKKVIWTLLVRAKSRTILCPDSYRDLCFLFAILVIKKVMGGLGDEDMKLLSVRAKSRTISLLNVMFA